MSSSNNKPVPSSKSSQSPSPQRGRKAENEEETLSERDNSRSPNQKKKKSTSRDSSKSPGKFSEDDFDRKRHSMSESERRKRAVAKMRGLKIDPKDWTRPELMEKISNFAKFSQDKKTGYSEVKILEGIRITSEDITALCELIRRNTEIQSLIIRQCALNDDHARELLIALKSVRHLKDLDMAKNSLHSSTVDLLINMFAKVPRHLDNLNLRDNPNLTYEDGRKLMSHFPYVQSLNNFPIAEFHMNTNQEAFDVSEYEIKHLEFGIITILLEQFHRVKKLNLRMNQLNAKALEILVNLLKINKYPSLREIDLSYNPVTNDSTNYTAILSLQQYLQAYTQLLRITLDGIILPSDILENIERALSVNRSVDGKSDGYYFNKFIIKMIETKFPSTNKMEEFAKWSPKLHEIDEMFVRKNRLSIPKVEITKENERAGTGFTIKWEKLPEETDFVDGILDNENK
jgi:hypothetical protein